MLPFRRIESQRGVSGISETKYMTAPSKTTLIPAISAMSL
jgi:hypothetical protein